MKQAGIYNPYWSTLGGGEKYTAAVIQALIQEHYQVTIYSHDNNLAQKILDRFGIDIHQVIISKNVPSKLDQLKLDLLFWVSDGSVPLMLSRKNLLHFQVPFHGVNGGSIANQLKLKLIHKVICNSNFTKEVIDKEFDCCSQILYPPSTMIPTAPKTNTILSVGRFDNHLHAKRQDTLITAFKQLNIPDWQLILAGGALDGEAQLEALKTQSGNANIKLVVNPSHAALMEYYSQASLYWHAAGFGSDLTAFPERAEHFGISTVEAMSAGAVPFSFNGGGQKEIIQPGDNGYLWNTIEELVELTRKVITDREKRVTMSKQASESVKKFSTESFNYAIKKSIR